MTDLNKSIQELKNEDWEPASYPSFLVQRCNELRRKPLKDFSIEDLRIMIGQQFDLELLVPLALDFLKDNPLAEGDYFPGDLLKNVLEISNDYWDIHREQYFMINEIVKKLDHLPDFIDESYKIFSRNI